MNRLAAMIVAVGPVQTEPRRGFIALLARPAFRAKFAEAGLESKQ